MPGLFSENSNNEISNYVSTAYGKAGGSYSCSSNIDGIFKNINQLKKGSHTITCVAKGNNGLVKNNISYLIIANNNFIKNKSDDLVVTFTELGSQTKRNFYKKNNNISLVGLCNYTKEIKWLGPVFVSNESLGTAYYTSGNYEANIPENYSFTYLNQSWYVSPSAAFYPPNVVDIFYTSLQNITNLKKVEYFNDEVECAKAIIDLSIQN